jgi:L-threonylcarbamoyladenylate synthase
MAERLKEDEGPKAPGMKYKHYAPKAELVLVRGSQAEMSQRIKHLAEKASLNKKVGIIATEESSRFYNTFNKERPFVVKSIGTRHEEESIARHLYAVLREFDDLDVDVIYSESFEGTGIAEAVMDRMFKAAGMEV